MGRKSRAKQAAKPHTASAYTNKKEVNRLVQRLIQREIFSIGKVMFNLSADVLNLPVCVTPTTRKNDWDTYLQIDFVIQRIRQYQTGQSKVYGIVFLGWQTRTLDYFGLHLHRLKAYQWHDN